MIKKNHQKVFRVNFQNLLKNHKNYFLSDISPYNIRIKAGHERFEGTLSYHRVVFCMRFMVFTAIKEFIVQNLLHGGSEIGVGLQQVID